MTVARRGLQQLETRALEMSWVNSQTFIKPEGIQMKPFEDGTIERRCSWEKAAEHLNSADGP